MAAQHNFEPNNIAQMFAQEVQAKTRRPLYPLVDPGNYHQELMDGQVEEYSTRGEAWSDLLSCLTSALLRLGFLLQLLVLVFGYALYYGHGGTGVFTFDIFTMPEKLRSSEAYTTIMIILESVTLTGCICISSFQIYVADNSKAGSKILGTAAALDTFVVGLRLMQYIYAHHFLGHRWWMKYNQSNADWCLFFSGTLIHSLALGLYGLAIFYMEAYHDEGTYEEWSWLILALFSSAGLFVFTGFGNFYSFIHILALSAAVIWAFSFEPLLHFYSPAFHDRDVSAEMGKQEEGLELSQQSMEF